MDGIQLRKARMEDVDRIWQIILQAKEQMRLRNSLQWQDGYPSPENIAHDRECGYGHVLCLNDTVIAYAAVIFDGEPAYENIRGQWLSDRPYVVVHRLAVADEMKRQGVATRYMQKIEALSREKGIRNFRVDTNFDNLYMQRIFAKLGFTYCGEVQYNQNRRMAYEKVL
ncbi:MAG: GNAT family N-acetyltransferase [Dysgonamonadaceae bacterium]|jgi:N-acetylglutamate synthase-like GNAT family acetyltransferase|nr:GNAT family N-acetyltransferase [Dysgonamonadaceae bacterium]